jgi:hypothetical protein
MQYLLISKIYLNTGLSDFLNIGVSQCPRVMRKICEIKGGQEICVICEICVRQNSSE